MILVVGEILYDVFPEYKRLGGAPFNFAFHLKNLGFPVRFISRVGNDTDGKDILEKLEHFGFNSDDIQIDQDRPTGTVQVTLDQSGVPTFAITQNVAYDYIEFVPEMHLQLIHKSELIYFGTLVQRKSPGFNTVQALLSNKPPSARCFYDINLRPACYSEPVVRASLSRTNVLKINQEELDEIKGMLKYNSGHSLFMKYLMDTYPLEIIALTRGAQGSEIYTKGGLSRVKSKKTGKIIDSVGAGDAYAAMLAAGLLKGWRPDTILNTASVFASHICMIKGAVPESASFYEPFTPMIKQGKPS